MKNLLVCLSALASFGLARPSSHYSMGPARAFTPTPGNEVTEISFSNGFVVDTRTGESSIPDALRLPDFQPGPAYYIVQFNGPIRQQWSRELSRLGVRPFGYLPSYAVLAKLDPAQRVAVQALPMVRWVGLFQPAYKVQDVLLGASGTVKLVIVVTPGEEHRPILDVLADCGAPYADVAESDFCTSITVTVPASAIAAIAQLQEVVWVQLWTEPEFCNSNCQWVVQTGWRSTAPPDTSMTARRVWANGVRGQRVILSTTDSGLNMGHDLFRDPALSVTAPGIWPTHRKVVAFKLYPGAHQGEAPYHGSHVNGTAAGDDSVTGGTSYHDGMSIKGRLYFVDISNSSGGLVTGTDLTELWDSVYLGRGLPDSLRPIRQHSGSWGWSNSSGTYLLQDATTDNYSWVRKDFLNIMAAANSGPGARTVANPGLAKNVITVGATQNGTSSNAIASFSSRGPTADNRLKPTLCAPGVALYSATASGSSTYQSMNGTSMATPAVNGTVGLMRCYLRQGYYPSGAANPADSISYISAALLRSMAVASADPNIGSYTVPDFNIGWGRIDADSVLFFAGDLRKLIVKDDTSGVATGQFKEEQFVVNSSIPLRIALAWTDTAAAPSAARALVNNLNLEVVAPGGTVYRGNQYSGGQSVSNPTIWDTLNVEECVRVNSPATGVWTIRVYGFQVATAARQPFAYTITGDISKDFRDVGVRRIMAPTGMVDSGSIVTPACSVANYGSSSETYTVRMRIGSGYNQTATVTNHPAGTRRYVTFPTWTALARGTHMVSCSTELVGDGYPANDRQTDSVVVRVRDVGCRALLAPSGTVDSGSVTVPACTVYNYGSGAVSYNVRMRIGTGYNNTAAVTNHAGGTALYVTFPSWTANLARGTYAVTCSTELSGDIVPANDRRTGTVTIRVLDAATVALLAPSGVVDSGAVVIPACTVANRGTQSATYTVRMRIGTTYNQAVAVSAQPPGAKQYLTFPAWTAEQVVVHAVSCSTELSGDLAQANDKLTGSVTVRPRDVSCTRILVPTGTLDSATTVVPSCSVVNYSGVAVSYTVRMKVGATYNQAVAVNNHPAGTRRYVTFPAWTANVARGGHAVSCSTELAGDANPANDRSTTQIDIRVRDVACQNLLAPSGTIDSGSVVVPSCSSYNHGSVASSYTVRMRIGSGYSSPVTVLNHSAGASRYVTFPSWTANERGSLAVSCSTELSGDLNEANNRQSGQVMVVVRDVGCVALVAPAGIVDSGTTVTPICTVANFSTTAETYAVRMRIGSGYSQTVTVTNQAPLTRQQVTFPDWTAHEPGVLAVSCSTELAGDANQANNRRTGSVDVRVRDVGCVVLVAPAGTVDSGAAVTPACTVANFGNGAETYTVRMRIGSGYDRTATVTSHPAGTRRYVTFPTWTALTRGTNAVSCSTELAGDVRPGNDQVTGLVDVRVRDVGAASVLAPSGTLDSGTVVTPVCTVANFGTTTETYAVRMRIGTLYDRTVMVSDHVPDTRLEVVFPDWTAGPRGSQSVRCSTELSGDGQPGNNRLTGVVDVAVRDVGAAVIVAPSGAIDSGELVVPVCTVANFGTTVESYSVRMRIGTDYSQSAAVADHAPGTRLEVAFPVWAAHPRGMVAVSCSTELGTDMNQVNDRRTGLVGVGTADAAVVALLSPPENVLLGSVLTPSARVRNMGSTAATFDVRFTIGTNYLSVRTVTDLARGDTTTVAFDHWTAVLPGRFAVACSTMLAGDDNPMNDRLAGQVRVDYPWPSGWREARSMPGYPSSRPSADGAWLTHDAGRGLIYAAKGNKTSDFFSYNPARDSWAVLASMPAGTEGKPPAKGSAGCADGSGTVYATKGNNTQGFYKYVAPRDSWCQLADVPLGSSRKKVKGGTDMVYRFQDQGFVYVLKGIGNEFYRYDVAHDSWQTLAAAPAAKYDKGSWLCRDETAIRIYCHQAKYHGFHAYDIAASNWGPALEGMPFIGQSGRSKKSKDGGSAAWLAGTIHALKGGGTQEFWRFDPALGEWAELETMPQFGSSGKKKKVKAGGDITATSAGLLFALKGNKTNELWRYVPAVRVLGPALGTLEGVQSDPPLGASGAVLIAPNPCRSTAVVRAPFASRSSPLVLRIFDAGGRLVQTANCKLQTDTPIDLSSLPAGVYLLEAKAGGTSSAAKLVIRR